MATVNIRVQKYRDTLRAMGLRPIQIWVPDTRQKGFVEECRRQSKLIEHDLYEQNVLDWISSIADDKGWI